MARKPRKLKRYENMSNVPEAGQQALKDWLDGLLGQDMSKRNAVEWLAEQYLPPALNVLRGGKPEDIVADKVAAAEYRAELLQSLTEPPVVPSSRKSTDPVQESQRIEELRTRANERIDELLDGVHQAIGRGH